MEVGEDVQMVFGAIDAIQFSIVVFDNAPNVLVQFFAVLFHNCGFTIFCGENNLVKNLFVCALNEGYVGVLGKITSGCYTWLSKSDSFKVRFCFKVLLPNTPEVFTIDLFEVGFRFAIIFHRLHRRLLKVDLFEVRGLVCCYFLTVAPG